MVPMDPMGMDIEATKLPVIPWPVTSPLSGTAPKKVFFVTIKRICWRIHRIEKPSWGKCIYKYLYIYI